MAETQLSMVAGHIVKWENDEWIPLDNNADGSRSAKGAKVVLFHNTEHDIFRIVALNVATQQYVINCQLRPQTALSKVMSADGAIFMQWKQPAVEDNASFGVKFAPASKEAALTFFKLIEKHLNEVKEAFGVGVAPPPMIPAAVSSSNGDPPPPVDDILPALGAANLPSLVGSDAEESSAVEAAVPASLDLFGSNAAPSTSRAPPTFPPRKGQEQSAVATIQSDVKVHASQSPTLGRATTMMALSKLAGVRTTEDFKEQVIKEIRGDKIAKHSSQSTRPKSSSKKGSKFGTLSRRSGKSANAGNAWATLPMQDWTSTEWEDNMFADMPAIVKADTNLINAHDLVVRELFTSEYRYKLQLDTLAEIEKHMHSMIDQQDSTKKKSKVEMITAEEHKAIFANIGAILGFSTTFLAELKTCGNMYDPPQIVKSGSYSDREFLASQVQSAKMAKAVATAFARTLPFFKFYSLYCNSYDTAAKTVDLCKRARPAFADYIKFIEEHGAQSHGQSLASLLVTPVQRLPRFSLMLDTLVKSIISHEREVSSVEDADVSELTESLRDAREACLASQEKLTKILADMNVGVGTSSLQARLRSLIEGKEFDEALPQLVAPHRSLLWDGPVEVLLTNHKITYAILFSDLIVFFERARSDDDGSRIVELGKKEPNLSKKKESLHATFKRCTVKLPVAALWLQDDFQKGTEIQVKTPDLEFSIKTPADAELYETIIDAQDLLLRNTSNSEGHRQFAYTFALDDNNCGVAAGTTAKGWWHNAAFEGRVTVETPDGVTYTAAFHDGHATDASAEVEWELGLVKEPKLAPESATSVKEKEKPSKKSTKTAAGEEPVRHYVVEDSSRVRASYKGPVKDNLAHGKSGKLDIPFRGSYTGRFVEGQVDTTSQSDLGQDDLDRGKLTWVDGVNYRGDFSKGTMHGKGQIQLGRGRNVADGTVTAVTKWKYTGAMQRGLRHGTGSWSCTSGHAYQGEWVNDNMEGKGELTLPDGSIYKGEFFAGLRHGRGTFRSLHLKYEGEFDHDTFHGQGTLTKFQTASKKSPREAALMSQESISADEPAAWLSVYTGSFEHNLPHGHGTQKWADGSSYEGLWDHGNMHGSGTRVYPNGDVYSGSFKYNQRSGQGKLMYNSHVQSTSSVSPSNSYSGDDLSQSPMAARLSLAGGRRRASSSGSRSRSGSGAALLPSCYEGEWSYDLREGQGTIQYSNGDSYAGTWNADVWHGHGILTHAGARHQRLFDGKFEYGLRQGTGMLIDANLGRLEAVYERGVRNGAATLTQPNGEVVRMQFKDGRLHGPCAAVRFNKDGTTTEVESVFRNGECVEPLVFHDFDSAIEAGHEARSRPPEIPLPPDLDIFRT